MKAQEKRFLGNGNCWVGDGHYRGWQITCSRCGVRKLITSHYGSTPNPKSIIKRLVGAGWTVGHKPENDLCCKCAQHRAIEDFVHPPPPPPDNIIEMVDVSPSRVKPMSPHEWQVLDKLTTPDPAPPPPPAAPPLQPVIEEAPQCDAFDHDEYLLAAKLLEDDYDKWLGEVNRRHERDLWGLDKDKKE